TASSSSVRIVSGSAATPLRGRSTTSTSSGWATSQSASAAEPPSSARRLRRGGPPSTTAASTRPRTSGLAASPSRARPSRARSGSPTPSNASSRVREASSVSASSTSAGRPEPSRPTARGTSVNPARASTASSDAARCPSPVAGRAIASSDDADARQLVRRDLGPVVLPLLALVGEEVVEDVLAERVRDQLGGLHRTDGLLERARQRLDAERASLGLGELPVVCLGLVGQHVAILDALEPGEQDQRVGQVGVGGGVQTAVLDPGRLRLARLVHRHPHERRAVVVAPADVAGRL